MLHFIFHILFKGEVNSPEIPQERLITNLPSTPYRLRSHLVQLFLNYLQDNTNLNGDNIEKVSPIENKVLVFQEIKPEGPDDGAIQVANSPVTSNPPEHNIVETTG